MEDLINASFNIREQFNLIANEVDELLNRSSNDDSDEAYESFVEKFRTISALKTEIFDISNEAIGRYEKAEDHSKDQLRQIIEEQILCVYLQISEYVKDLKKSCEENDVCVSLNEEENADIGGTVDHHYAEFMKFSQELLSKLDRDIEGLEKLNNGTGQITHQHIDEMHLGYGRVESKLIGGALVNQDNLEQPACFPKCTIF